MRYSFLWQSHSPGLWLCRRCLGGGGGGGGGGGEKGNALLMNNLQLLQNKAAKTILDRPFYSSATDTLEALGWLTLMKRRSFHRCLYYSITFINMLMRYQPTVWIYWQIKMYSATIHSRHKDNLRLPCETKNCWIKEPQFKLLKNGAIVFKKIK